MPALTCSVCTAVVWLEPRAGPGANGSPRREAPSPEHCCHRTLIAGCRAYAGTVTVLASLCSSLSGAASSDGRHMATYSSYAMEQAVLCTQAWRGWQGQTALVQHRARWVSAIGVSLRQTIGFFLRHTSYKGSTTSRHPQSGQHHRRHRTCASDPDPREHGPGTG